MCLRRGGEVAAVGNGVEQRRGQPAMPAHDPCQRRRTAPDDRGRDVCRGPHPDDGHGTAVASRHHLHLARLALETETAQQPPVQIVRLRIHLIGANAEGDHIGPGRNGSGEGHGNGHGGPPLPGIGTPDADSR